MKTKTQFSNRILSLALAFVMVLGLLPMTAVAIKIHSHPVCGKTHTDIGDHTGACEAIEWTEWKGTAIIESGSYYLSDNISIDKLTISQNITVSLCLNGKTLSVKDFPYLEKKNLNICDCTGGGVLNFNSDNIHMQISGRLNLYGGILTSKSSQIVNLYTDNTSFHMYDGKIIGSRVIVDGGIFRMYGGEISGSTMGGAILYNGTMAIYDGAVISGNSSTSSTWAGGVTVYRNSATLEIHGGRITGNTRNNEECNVQLPEGGKITVGEDLSQNILIGVTAESAPCTFSVGGAAYADKGYFKSDDSAYMVAADGNDLKLVKQFTVSFNANGGTGSMGSVNVTDGAEYTLPDNPFTAPSGGKQFKGWATSASGDVITTETITVTDDTTLYAIWEKIPAEAPSVEISGNLTLTYGEFTNQKITATVEEKDDYIYSYQWVNDDNRVIGETETLNIADDTAVGIYNYACNVIATRKDNGEYKTITIRGIWVKVNAKELNSNSADVTLSQTTFTYNGEEQRPAVEVTHNGKVLTKDTDYTISWPADCKNAGFKTITVNFIGNYSGSVTKTFEIQKAPLTVTAKPHSIIYGDAPANNGVIYSGFVPDENENVLGGTLAYDYTYSQYGNVGDYDITVSGLTSDNYEITFAKGTLTVEQKEIGIRWGATDFSYNGTAQKPTATATGTVNGDELTLTVSGEQTNASDTAYTATVTGINGEKEGNYKLPSNVTANFTIGKAAQAAPTVTKADETIFGKADGKLKDVDSTMEYRAEGESTYTAITGSTVENLAAGKYFVRYAADSNHNASPDTAIIVGEGRKLQIVVPQNQVGYTVTVNKTEMEYEGSYTLKVEIHEGYTATGDFKIIISNWECGQQAGVEETYMNAIADQIIEVQGVADITEPTAEIKIENNKWTSFWNKLTLGLFFKETQDVTITATDAGSGVKSIEYYLSCKEMELDELRSVTDWQPYEGAFKIDPNNRYVIYARITDNAGCMIEINSDSIVLDNIAPTIEGIENGQTYYGDITFKASDDYFDGVTVDDNDVTPTDGAYTIVADNGEHAIVATDKSGNKTEYKVTVYKNYTVTYKADGEPISAETVGHGKDATIPAVPSKDGYVGKWNSDGKNITEDTTVSVVYTEIPVVKPDEVKPEDKTDLEDAKKQLEDMLEDDSYTDDDKKDIQDAINDIDDALEVIGNVEAVEELIDKLPDTVKKDDEAAIKAADDAYNALTDYEKSLVDADAKKALADAKAALAELNKPAAPNSPATGDNSNLLLWIVLLFISGGAAITLTVVDRKRRKAKRKKGN